MKKIVVGDVCKTDNHYVCIQPPFETHSGGQSMTVECVKNKEPMKFDPSRFIAFQLPTLHLPIGNDPKKYGGAWFDMILSGEKGEEYRECSLYNERRLTIRPEWDRRSQTDCGLNFKPFKVLHLTNGYNHNCRQLWAHIEEISIGRGKPEWGAPTDRDTFVIKLGDVFHSKNIRP